MCARFGQILGQILMSIHHRHNGAAYLLVSKADNAILSQRLFACWCLTFAAVGKSCLYEFTELNFLSVGSQLPPRTLNLLIDWLIDWLIDCCCTTRISPGVRRFACLVIWANPTRQNGQEIASSWHCRSVSSSAKSPACISAIADESLLLLYIGLCL